MGFLNLGQKREENAQAVKSGRDLRVKSTLDVPETVTANVPFMDDKLLPTWMWERGSTEASPEDQVLMHRIGERYMGVISGGWTTLPVLRWLFYGFIGAYYADRCVEEKPGLDSNYMTHKWIRPVTAEQYAISYFSGMSRIFVPLLTVFSLCLAVIVAVTNSDTNENGYYALALDGAEMYGCLGFTLVLSLLILISMVGAICKRYIYFRLLRHGTIIDFENPTGLTNYLGADRYKVSILSILYAAWAIFVIQQLVGNTEAGAAGVVGPIITAALQLFMLLAFNATVLNVEETGLLTLNKLIEHAKMTFAPNDDDVQGALAFFMSVKGLSTEDETPNVAKDFAADDERHIDEDGVYLHSNLKNVMRRVRYSRAKYIMGMIGMRHDMLSVSEILDLARNPERDEELKANCQRFAKLLAEENMVVAGMVPFDKDDPKVALEQKEERVLAALEYALGKRWTAFHHHVADFLTLRSVCRPKAQVRVLSQRLFFALNEVVDWMKGVNVEEFKYGPMEPHPDNDADEDHALCAKTVGVEYDYLCVGWHKVMSGAFGTRRIQQWDDEIKKKDADEERFPGFCHFRIWDRVKISLSGIYFSFLQDNVLGSIEDYAFTNLVQQLTGMAGFVVTGFVCYTGYLAIWGIEDTDSTGRRLLMDIARRLL